MKKLISIAIVYCLAALLILSIGISQAASVTLAWDANSEPDLKDYIIYHGTKPGDYSKTYILSEHPEMRNPNCGTVYDPFKTACCEIIIPDLSAGNNYFAATALDDQENESAYSEELEHFVKLGDENIILEMPFDFEKIPDDPVFN